MSDKDKSGYEISFFQKVMIGLLVTSFFIVSGLLLMKILELSKITKSTGLSSEYKNYPNLAQKINQMSLKCKGKLPLLVNKRAGMVVHTGFNNYTGTLINALLYHVQNLPTYSDEMRPGLVHRIDKDTSGLLLIAKTENALVYLAKQFFDHSISRVYNALVWGDLKDNEGTINANLSRDLKDRRLAAVFLDETIGKKAITHYKVIERFGFATLIECKLETGRTHQIRAHMKYLGHPLFADETYGGLQIVKQSKMPKFEQFIDNCFKIIPRQALHARTLGFIHPTSLKPIHFESALPNDFNEVLIKIRQYVIANT